MAEHREEKTSGWHAPFARLGFTSHHGVLAGILIAVLALYLGVLGKNVIKALSAGEGYDDHAVIISEEVESVDEMDALFLDEGYDLNLDDPGTRTEVPAVLIRSFPEGFSADGDLQAHKERFIEVMLPLVLSENARLRRERAGLIALERKSARGMSFRDDEVAYLERLATLYNAEEATPKALMAHVDEIPVSLALAQSAEESGWGRSRFVREGNALFGQWTYNPEHEGLVPEGREVGKKHRIRAFPSLRYSVRTYMRNLNSHPAYQAFRDARVDLRAEGKPLSGARLAQTLTKYSERGADYVRSIQAIIDANNLTAYRKARLRP